jgi:hypothetical protein
MELLHSMFIDFLPPAFRWPRCILTFTLPVRSLAMLYPNIYITGPFPGHAVS